MADLGLKIGSLFSGIGGLELGLEMAGLGHTVWQVERDEYCRRVLARHWPGALRFDDVCEVGGENLGAVDIICGGFPCQDVSSAGLRKGLAGERSGLWFEYLRIVRELRPRWVVVENVASGASRYVDTVMAGLEGAGYRAVPFPLSAADVGAPHERGRIFVVARLADSDCPQREGGSISGGVQQEHPNSGGSGGDAWCASAASDSDCDDIREQPRRISGRASTTEPQLTGEAGETAGHADRGREPAEPEHGQAPIVRRAASGPSAWAASPGICRVDDGVPGGVVGDRTRRLKALGNAVVPQCAEVIGWVIRELMEAENG